MTQGLLDDLEIVRGAGCEDILLNNPVEKTPAATIAFRHEGYSFNARWLRYVYLLGRMRTEQLLFDGASWVDVGSYYGGLSGLALSEFRRLKICLVDFSHQLCRSYIYLKSLFPDLEHIFPDDLPGTIAIKDFPLGSIIYVPVGKYRKIAGELFDLATNFYSFGEMKRAHFLDYYNSSPFQKSSAVYLVNRFVSAPHFEATYDTDLDIRDYLLEGKLARYFDVFPMHHYNVVERRLYGRLGGRPVSSPYFELIYNNEH